MFFCQHHTWTVHSRKTWARTRNQKDNDTIHTIIFYLYIVVFFSTTESDCFPNANLSFFQYCPLTVQSSQCRESLTLFIPMAQPHPLLGMAHPLWTGDIVKDWDPMFALLPVPGGLVDYSKCLNPPPLFRKVSPDWHHLLSYTQQTICPFCLP